MLKISLGLFAFVNKRIAKASRRECNIISGVKGELCRPSRDNKPNYHQYNSG